MAQLIHLASRLFEVPLAIQAAKLEVLIGAVGMRMGIEVSAEQIEAAANSAAKSRNPYQSSGHIGVVDIAGTLVKKSMGPDLDALCGITSYGQIKSDIQAALADPNISQIALNVDSPGGECAGCFDLADWIASMRGQKPILAFANSALSAAYALASSADKIFVDRMSGVGSIGVIGKHIDQSGADAQAGIKYTTIYSGAHKNDFDSHAPLSDAGLASLQAEVDRINHQIFIPTVARNRNMTDKQVASTEAAMYFGQDGIAAGLADGKGSLEEFLASPRKKVYSIPGATAAGNSKPKESIMDEQEIAAAVSTAKQEGIKTGRAEGYAEAQAHAMEVIELCAMAAMPDKVLLDFIKANAKPVDVRKSILAARAEADSGSVITPTILPGTGASANNQPKPEESAVVKEANRLLALSKKGAVN